MERKLVCKEIKTWCVYVQFVLLSDQNWNVFTINHHWYSCNKCLNLFLGCLGFDLIIFYRRDGLSALSPSHPLAEISVSATSHLSAPHIDYLIHWTALLLLEDSYTSGAAQKDLWCLDPEQRYVAVMNLMSQFERGSLNSWAPSDCSLHPPISPENGGTTSLWSTVDFLACNSGQCSKFWSRLWPYTSSESCKALHFIYFSCFVFDLPWFAKERAVQSKFTSWINWTNWMSLYESFYCSTCFECYYIHLQEPVTVCRCTVL